MKGRNQWKLSIYSYISGFRNNAEISFWLCVWISPTNRIEYRWKIGISRLCCYVYISYERTKKRQLQICHGFQFYIIHVQNTRIWHIFRVESKSLTETEIIHLGKNLHRLWTIPNDSNNNEENYYFSWYLLWVLWGCRYSNL